jgi:hypothetical protein
MSEASGMADPGARDGHFVCVFCDADLPERGNVDP